MRKLLTAVLAAGFIVAAGLGSSGITLAGADEGTAAEGGEQTVVRISHIAALTGDISAANEAQIRGMDLALEQVNSTGRYRIEIEREDSGADPAVSVGLMRENGANDDIVLQIGPAASGEYFSAIPLAADLELPTYSIIAGGIYPGEYNEWTWNTGLPETAAVPGLLEYAESIGAETIGVMYASDLDFANTAAEAFSSAAEEAGFELVTETFSGEDVSFAAQVSNMQAENPDLIYLADIPQQAGFVLKAIRDGGITVPTMSTDNSVGNHALVAENAQGAAEGHVIVSAFDPFSTRPIVTDYIAAFEEAYPDQQISFDPFGYDGIMLVKAALESIDGEVTREAVRDAMASVSIEGVTGTEISFPDGFGVASREGLAVLQLTADGEAEPLT